MSARVDCAGMLQSFAHAMAYLVNLVLPAMLADAAGQAGAIPAIALLTFVLQKYWVFRR